MNNTKTQSWCPTCGQNERATERIDELTEQLETLNKIGLESDKYKEKYENNELSMFEREMYRTLTEKLTLETQRREEAEKALGFYGDWDTWEKFDLNLPFQCIKDEDLQSDHGGKTAREHFKKWGSE